MLALILAGGRGTRLNVGEKPLVTIGNRPMVEHVISAFEAAGCEVWVVLSHWTPYTQNWCRSRGFHAILTKGSGYIEDIAEAVQELEVRTPFLTGVADTPCISPGIISEFISRYEASRFEACSSWVPLPYCSPGRRIEHTWKVEEVPSVPAGLNIIRGDLIAREQTEMRVLIRDRKIGWNINTRQDLELVQAWFRRQSGTGQ